MPGDVLQQWIDAMPDTARPSRAPPAPANDVLQQWIDAMPDAAPNLRPDPQHEEPHRLEVVTDPLTGADTRRSDLTPVRGFLSDLSTGKYPHIYKPGGFSGAPGGHVLSSAALDLPNFAEGMHQAPGVTLSGAAAPFVAPYALTAAPYVGRGAYGLGKWALGSWPVRTPAGAALIGAGERAAEAFLPEELQPWWMQALHHYVLSSAGH
jgi:hypothetical protein